jgi:c-di-GMP-binding flagellar brake protein YcgR
LSAPLEKGALYPLRAGENILVSFSRDNSGIYDFYADVVARKKAGHLSAIIIRKTSDIRKTQRRHYFRFSYVGEFEILKEEKEKEGLDQLKEKYKDNSDIIIDETEKHYLTLDGRDISGGGFRAVSREAFEDGTIVSGRVKLDQKVLEFKAKIIRSSLIDGPYPKYDIAFEFVELDNRVRAEIISFIFKKERKTRNEK